MINTRLVLGSLSVYTFYVSKATFEDKDIVSMSIRGHETLVVGRDAGFEAFRTGARMVWPHALSPQSYI
jgi:hypothetical protein